MNIMGVFTCTHWFCYMKKINTIYRYRYRCKTVKRERFTTKNRPLITEVDKSKIFRARVPVQGVGKKQLLSQKESESYSKGHQAGAKVTRQVQRSPGRKICSTSGQPFIIFFLKKNKVNHGRKSLGKTMVGSCKTGFHSLQLIG